MSVARVGAALPLPPPSRDEPTRRRSSSVVASGGTRWSTTASSSETYQQQQQQQQHYQHVEQMAVLEQRLRESADENALLRGQLASLGRRLADERAAAAALERQYAETQAALLARVRVPEDAQRAAAEERFWDELASPDLLAASMPIPVAPSAVAAAAAAADGDEDKMTQAPAMRAPVYRHQHFHHRQQQQQQPQQAASELDAHDGADLLVSSGAWSSVSSPSSSRKWQPHVGALNSSSGRRASPLALQRHEMASLSDVASVQQQVRATEDLARRLGEANLRLDTENRQLRARLGKLRGAESHSDQQRRQLMGAVRRIHWLLSEVAKLQAARDAATEHARSVEKRMLQLDEELEEERRRRRFSEQQLREQRAFAERLQHEVRDLLHAQRHERQAMPTSPSVREQPVVTSEPHRAMHHQREEESSSPHERRQAHRRLVWPPVTAAGNHSAAAAAVAAEHMLQADLAALDARLGEGGHVVSRVVTPQGREHHGVSESSNVTPAGGRPRWRPPESPSTTAAPAGDRQELDQQQQAKLAALAAEAAAASVRRRSLGGTGGEREEVAPKDTFEEVARRGGGGTPGSLVKSAVERWVQDGEDAENAVLLNADGLDTRERRDKGFDAHTGRDYSVQEIASFVDRVEHLEDVEEEALDTEGDD
jgi:hypothetical protein